MSLRISGRDFKSYIKDVGSSKPKWLDFTKKIAQYTGQHKLLDYTTAFNKLEQFVFQTNNWTIGGMAFDGIMRTEHSSEVKLTHYPVQSGAVMTDHAIVMPTTLDISVMVSDATTTNSLSGIGSGNFVKNLALKYLVNRYLTSDRVIAGNNRSQSAFRILKAMQNSRVPITVVTRLKTYNNMIIDKITVNDDVSTLYALNANIHLTQIQVADIATVQVSSRPHISENTSGGAKSVDSNPSNSNQTALKALGKGFNKL